MDHTSDADISPIVNTDLITDANVPLAGLELSSPAAFSKQPDTDQNDTAPHLREARFRAAFTHAAIGFALTTLDGRFIEANPAYYALTGYTLEELRGLSFEQLIHPDDRAGNMVQIARLVAGDISHFVVQNRYRRKNGEPIWVQASVSLAQDEAGQPRWIVALIENITARKEAEARLEKETQATEESHALLSSLLLAAPLGFCFLDRERRYQMINAPLAEINGIPAQDHIGRTYREIIPALADALDALFDQVMATGEVIPGFLLSGETSKEPGVQRHWLESWYPIKERDGKILGAGVFVNEVTAQKRAETALHAAHDTFRHLVDNSPFGLYAVDADFRLTQVSAGAQNVFANVRPLIGRDFAEVLRILWPEPFASEAIALFRHTLATGETYHAPSCVEYRQDTGVLEAYDWKIERVLLPDGRFGVVCHFYDLSERHHYEAILRERDQFITEFTSLIPGVLYVFDLTERRNIYVNRQTGLTLGYSPDEITEAGERFLPGVLHPEDAPRLNRHLEQLATLPDGLTAEIQYRFRHRDGSWHWFQSRDAVFRRDARGGVKQTLGIASDITEQKATEEELRQSQGVLQAIYDGTDEYIGLLTPYGTLLEVNRAMHAFANSQRDEVIGLPFWETVWFRHTPGAPEAVQQAVLRAAAGEYVRFETPLFTPAGVRKTFDISLAPIRNESGEVIFLLPEGRDITERKHSEERLHKSEERFRIAEKASHSFVYEWDITTGTEERSEGFTRLLGYRQEEFPYGGTAWETLIHPEDVAKVRAATEKGLTTNPPVASVEYRLRHKNGTWLWVLDEFTVLPAAQSRGERIVGTIIDISVQKQQQQEINNMNVRLQRAVAETHHRVKNNLQMLSALVDIQVGGSAETVPLSSLRRIDQHIRTLATIHDLLTLESKTAKEQDTVSLKATLERLAAMLQATAGSRKIQVQVEEMRGTLKQSGSFALLLNELVSNALKHGKGDVEITLSLSPATGQEGEGRIVRLEVCDDGPGFPPDFDPGRAANTGLELIESMGRWDLRGQTAYENREEGGARVVVTFPLAETMERQQNPSLPSETARNT